MRIESSLQRGFRARLVGKAGELLHRRVLVRQEVRALDASVALSGEAGAIRILIAGSGITSGWGVSVHGLALVGAVQRSLQRQLGHPVDAVQASRVGALLIHAPEVIDDHLRVPTDAVVLAFGWSDAFALTSVQRWEETLTGVLDLLVLAQPGLSIVVTGLPPMDRLGITGLLGPLIRRHGERLNAASMRVLAGRRDATFVELAAPVNRDLRPWGSPEAYHAWSLPIAAAVATTLKTDNPPRLDGRRTGDAVHPEPEAANSDEADQLVDAVPPLQQREHVARTLRDVIRTLGVPSLAAVVHRLVNESLDEVRMRTWIHGYAMQVLEDMGHPPLTGEHGGPFRTLVVGHDPIRVLFFGAGLADGYGVQDRSDAVDGPFAHSLAAARGRGVVLENRAKQHLRLDHATTSLGAVGTFSYDLAVWFPSFTDGIERMRPSWWRSHLHTLIRELRVTEQVPLLLTHMPLPGGLHPAAIVARPWVRRLNRIIDQVANEWDDVATAPTEPFYPADIGQKITDRAYFRAVSGHLQPAAQRLLDTARQLPGSREETRSHRRQ